MHKGIRNLRDFGMLALAAGKGWRRDGAASMGAALAFYTLFSMAPLLLLVIAIAGFAIGSETARDLLMTQLTALVGDRGAAAIRSLLEASDTRSKTWIAAAISMVTLVLGASSVFAELRNDLDKIWRYEAPPRPGAWAFVRDKVLSVGMILTIGFLLMVSLVVSAAVSAIGHFWADALPGSTIVLQGLDLLGSFLVFTGLFAAIYKILPNVRIEWSDVWVGAAVTSLLFWIGKWLIGLYIAHSAVTGPFGAAGTLIIVILWVYYSAQIFFLGAEFTREYALRRGSLMADAAAKVAAGASPA